MCRSVKYSAGYVWLSVCCHLHGLSEMLVSNGLLKRWKAVLSVVSKSVTSGKNWLRIINALHLSSGENEATREFDQLEKIKPLYKEMREVCTRNYHSLQETGIDENGCLKSKGYIQAKMKGKHVFRGFNYFLSYLQLWIHLRLLCLWGENSARKGLSYDSLTRLIKTSLLGTGYK